MNDAMNGAQSVFALFFAIFWGSIMNVSGRWRMFYPMFWHRRVRSRFLLSFALMTVLPVGFFAWQFGLLSSSNLNSFWDVVRAVLPALFIYVFYRGWMIVVGFWPRRFYWSEDEPIPDYLLRRIDPSVEKLGLLRRVYCWGNAAAAVLYIVVALGIPWLICILQGYYGKGGCCKFGMVYCV